MSHKPGYTVGDVCRWLSVAVPDGLSGKPLAGFCTDTREDCEGRVFVGLVGENCDGSRFYEEAFRKGAALALVNSSFTGKPPFTVEKSEDKLLIALPDTLSALAECARKYLAELKRVRVVAITGSCGKTTTKEMLRMILSGEFRTTAARKSYNNSIGVPLTVLSAPSDVEVLVLEFGTNARGEIASLCAIAKPDISIITAVAPSHLQGLGSLEGVFKEKTDIIRCTRHGGVAIVNADAVEVNRAPIPPNGRRIVTSTKRKDVDLFPDRIEVCEDGLAFVLRGYEGFLKTGALHFLSNALCAVAVADVLGVELRSALDALKEFSPPKMRMEVRSEGEIRIINDAYNANPLSVRAAVEHLGRLDCFRRRILVFGGMLELGDATDTLHREVGEFVASSGVDVLITVGEVAKVTASAAIEAGMESVFAFNDAEEAGSFLRSIARSGDVILLKASRRIRLESIIRDHLCRKDRRGSSKRTA